MPVAIEQARGEKYRSMDVSLAVVVRFRTGIDFYTVPHNIDRVKEFIAKWYKKVRSRPRRQNRRRLLPNPNAVVAPAPMSPKRRSARRWICFGRTASPPRRS